MKDFNTLEELSVAQLKEIQAMFKSSAWRNIRAYFTLKEREARNELWKRPMRTMEDLMELNQLRGAVLGTKMLIDLPDIIDAILGSKQTLKKEHTGEIK